MSDRHCMTAKSKTLACWAAVIAGFAGAHRFYLHGGRDSVGWAHVLLSLPGLYGIRRMNLIGQDDQLAWILIPLLGLSIAAAMGMGLFWGLMAEENWARRYPAPNGVTDHGETSWLTVLGVIAALMVGATVVMATIAFSAQRFFEYQALRPLPAAHTQPDR